MFVKIFLHNSKQAVILLSCESPWWTYQWELRLSHNEGIKHKYAYANIPVFCRTVHCTAFDSFNNEIRYGSQRLLAPCKFSFNRRNLAKISFVDLFKYFKKNILIRVLFVHSEMKYLLTVRTVCAIQ